MMNRVELETRRLRAAAEVQHRIDTNTLTHGAQARIARRYGVSRTTMAKWVNKLQQGGTLQRTVCTGRPSRLTGEARDQARTWILSNPTAPLREFRNFIEQTFGISYDADHCSRIRKRLTAEVAN